MKKTITQLSFFFFLIFGCAAGPQYILAEQDENVESAIVEEPETTEETVPEVCTKPKIALTFDDGPNENTGIILDVLEQYGARATFFMLGEYIEEWQDTVKRAAENGNEIAGHAWSHKQLILLSNQAIEESLKNTGAIIEQVTGIPGSPFFRAPYGSINRRVADVAAGLGYAIVHWDIDTEDWKLKNANLIYNAVMRSVRKDAVILLHDFPHTAEAVKRIIPALINEGYQLVTVSELFDSLEIDLKPGMVYGSPGYAGSR